MLEGQRCFHNKTNTRNLGHWYLTFLFQSERLIDSFIKSIPQHIWKKLKKLIFDHFIVLTSKSSEKGKVRIETSTLFVDPFMFCQKTFQFKMALSRPLMQNFRKFSTSQALRSGDHGPGRFQIVPHQIYHKF